MPVVSVRDLSLSLVIADFVDFCADKALEVTLPQPEFASELYGR